MKPNPILLGSLVLNLALAGTFLFLHGRSASAPPTESAHAPAVRTNLGDLPTALAVATNLSDAAPIPFQWSMLEAEDPREFVARLRGVDCPEHVVRELLVAKVERTYRPKLMTEPVNYAPWVGRDRRDADRRSERNRVASGRREQIALIRELLGYDWNSEVAREWIREPAAGAFLGFLTDLKAQQVIAQVMASVQTLEDQMNVFESRIVIDEDIERLTRLRVGISTELSRLLTPQELDELETRAQLGLLFSDNLHVGGMDATGAELRAIMHASRSYKDFFTSIMLERGSRGEDRDKGPKRAEFEAALLTSLGPTRFAEFQRSQDKDFRDTFEFTMNNNLPRATAVSLYEAQQTAEAQRREITNDPGFTAEERKAALEVLQTATAASVASTLGKQFTNYFNGNGHWLNQLSSAATVKPTARDARR